MRRHMRLVNRCFREAAVTGDLVCALLLLRSLEVVQGDDFLAAAQGPSIQVTDAILTRLVSRQHQLKNVAGGHHSFP